MIIKKTRKSKKYKKSTKTRSKRQMGGGQEDQEEKDNYLFDAIGLDDPDKVERALNNGADVNAKNNNDDWAALIEASYYGHTEIVGILLDKGADVSSKTKKGDTALIHASYRGHIEIVRMLLKNRADVNARNDDGGTALIAASETGQTEIVSDLLKNGADVHAKDDTDYTAIEWAVEFGHTPVVDLLRKAIEAEQKVRGHKQEAMGLVRDRHEKPASLVTQIHREMDTYATNEYNNAVREGAMPAPGSGSNSKLGGKRKTRKSKKSKKSKKTRSKKKEFLYNPNDPSKSFDVYIDKNPSDTIPIKYTTVKDVRDTISKLERLYKNKKYPHKRIWQVGMIMKVRLEAMKKHKKTRYPNAKNVTARYNLANKYFKKLGKRSKELATKRRTRKYKH